jgi:predicted DNA-binding protein (UPF0251 family)
MTTTTWSNNLTPQEIEARRLVSIAEAAQLLSVSRDTVRRQYKDRFVRVSTRRLALRLRDILPET